MYTITLCQFQEPAERRWDSPPIQASTNTACSKQAGPHHQKQPDKEEVQAHVRV